MHAETPALKEINWIKDRIARVWARRETLKRALESGAIATRDGLQQLDETDRILSDLDSRFKALWDATRQGSPALHPAAQWALDSRLEPEQLDCVAAIMLKILDGKCKMGAAEKTAITAVYDVVREQPGQELGGEVHALIAQARQGADSALAESVHAWRVRAEATIPKPVMKGFKQLLRTSLPIHGRPASDNQTQISGPRPL